MYRINFGNGQVHGTFKTREEVARALASCNPDAYTFVQRYDPGSADDPGCWCSVPAKQVARWRTH